MIRAYTARAMTGRAWNELVLEASTDARELESRGITALDPVLAEIDQMGKIPVGFCGQGKNEIPLADHWARDKRMMREAHVLIDFSPEAKSHGIEKEVGYFRFFLFSPVVRFFRDGNVPTNSIMLFEDDLVVGSWSAMTDMVRLRWGTRSKRFRWRLGVYAKYWRRGVWQKLERWWQ